MKIIMRTRFKIRSVHYRCQSIVSYIKMNSIPCICALNFRYCTHYIHSMSLQDSNPPHRLSLRSRNSDAEYTFIQASANAASIDALGESVIALEGSTEGLLGILLLLLLCR